MDCSGASDPLNMMLAQPAVVGGGVSVEIRTHESLLLVATACVPFCPFIFLSLDIILEQSVIFERTFEVLCLLNSAIQNGA